VLDLLPASRTEGLKLADTSTWGGAIIPEIVSGGEVLYHMFASLIGGHCGLSTWKSNSQVVHATSYGSVTGPYSLAADDDDDGTVLASFAHNPSVRFDCVAHANGLPPFTLQHIGCGRANAEAPFLEGCTNGSTPPGAAAFAALNTQKALDQAAARYRDIVFGEGSGGDDGELPLCNQFNVSVRTASALSGPWEQVGFVSVVNPTGSEPWFATDNDRAGISNPALWRLANGSAVLAYRSDGADDSTEHVSIGVGLSDAHHAAVREPRYSFLLSGLVWGDSRTRGDGPAVFDDTDDPSGSEDPFLWDDAHGHLHLLMHELGTGHTGLHAFSRDGSAWTVSATRPYTGNVTFDDGSHQLMAHRERPQLVFDADTRRPVAFSTGVRPSSDDDYTYTLVNAFR